VNDQIRADNQSFSYVNERFLQLEAVNVNLETELNNLVRRKEELEMEPAARNIRDTKEFIQELARVETGIDDLRRMEGNLQKETIDLGDSVKEIDDAVDTWKEQREVLLSPHHPLRKSRLSFLLFFIAFLTILESCLGPQSSIEH